MPRVVLGGGGLFLMSEVPLNTNSLAAALDPSQKRVAGANTEASTEGLQSLRPVPVETHTDVPATSLIFGEDHAFAETLVDHGSVGSGLVLIIRVV